MLKASPRFDGFDLDAQSSPNETRNFLVEPLILLGHFISGVSQAQMRDLGVNGHATRLMHRLRSISLTSRICAMRATHTNNDQVVLRSGQKSRPSRYAGTLRSASLDRFSLLLSTLKGLILRPISIHPCRSGGTRSAGSPHKSGSCMSLGGSRGGGGGVEGSRLRRVARGGVSEPEGPHQLGTSAA